MNHESNVLELCAYLAILSLMAVGGGLVLVAPEVRDFVVGGKHWLQNEQFAAAYAIAQAAPGPNLLFISLIGWLVAGWFGAIVTTLSVIVPSTVLTLVLIRIRHRLSDGHLSQALKNAFTPISIGLLAATSWMFVASTNLDWRGYLLTLACAVIAVKTRLNPVVLIAAGAVAGITHCI